MRTKGRQVPLFPIHNGGAIPKWDDWHRRSRSHLMIIWYIRKVWGIERPQHVAALVRKGVQK